LKNKHRNSKIMPMTLPGINPCINRLTISPRK